MDDPTGRAEINSTSSIEAHFAVSQQSGVPRVLRQAVEKSARTQFVACDDTRDERL